MGNYNDGDINLEDHADESTCTHVLLEVEDFDASSRHSYLRLGAVDGAIKAKYEDLVDNGNAQTWDTETGEDLASLVTTFIDDERYRGKTGDKFQMMSKAARRNETKKLHTKGGWRDHTDGNRITTTRGDKLEVIRGNYKMRVLGRSQWNNDANGNPKGSGLHYESSGGITYQYDEVPGQIIDVRRSTDDDTWRVVEECDSGHFINRYHGVKKEWSRGGDVVDRVGNGTWDQSDTDFDRPDNASHQDGVTWPSNSATPAVIEEVYAKRIYEKTICQTHKSNEVANKVTDKIFSKTLVDEMYYDTFLGLSAGAMAREFWDGLFFENFTGFGISIKLGIFTDLRVGAAGETNIAAALVGVDYAAVKLGLEASLGWMDGYVSPLGFEFEFGGPRKSFYLTRVQTEMSFTRFAAATFFG